MLKLLKRIFYKFFPSAHASAFIRLVYLGKFLKNFNFKKALDAGCGPGLFTFFVAEKFPESQIVGYDISHEDIEKCEKEKHEKKINNVTFHRTSLLELSDEEEYDFIYSIDVLEHIKGNKKVIKNIYNALKPGGTLYLAMPDETNHRFIFSKNKHIQNYIKWTESEHKGDQYSLNELSKLLEETGFRIVMRKHTFGFFGKLAWELDMMTDNCISLKHLIQPFIFISGYLDTFCKNRPGSYGVLVIGKKDASRKS